MMKLMIGGAVAAVLALAMPVFATTPADGADAAPTGGHCGDVTAQSGGHCGDVTAQPGGHCGDVTVTGGNVLLHNI